ncbi:DUF6172 family protein [Xylophilus sp.]|uniref:DUF6172 family protein n=1 Tax=Xylophilus sp. TaxID=2653893 RepID=UPI0013BDBAEF|nr:DUF6172 family protein [Xylophilus sp.]KAF1047057.1 MAG: hypothetical protein GAK38_02101 [Xylophilus sp.]
MKKTFSIAVEGKNRDRLLEAVKHDIRKYLRRERRRDLPKGVDYWDFDVRFGLTEATAEKTHLANLIGLVSAAAAGGADSFYVEILARHGVRHYEFRDEPEPEPEGGAGPSAA